ncbi:microsomal signal peptidase 12 kDa subunit-domain-containing protein [Crassisporium funariophilum]|nr:microsomal signal peptidase 12 kDa subunit-domain-containing protein [Crassisporium funariophilum]
MSNAIQDMFEGKIDFAGQHLVDLISRVVLIASTVISFIVGFALQDLRITFAIMAASTFVLAFVVLPPWPMYNKHPVKWLPAVNSDKSKIQ